MNEIEKLNNFTEFLNNLDKDILIDLLAYLKKEKYKPDVIILFLEAFKSIYDHNDEHQAIEPYLDNPDDYAKQYIEILKKSGQINFIRDVNNDPYFISRMKKAEPDDKLGYIKDENGRYVISTDPTHVCMAGAVVSPLSERISILFDEVSKRNYSSLFYTIFHELSHRIKYNEIFIPNYVMNEYHFHQFLEEGHVNKMARRVNDNNNCISLSYPPNVLYAQRWDSKSIYAPYATYYYLYFKIEFLLGLDFINDWNNKKDSTNFLSVARKKINEMYGEETFIRLYKDIQLILSTIDDVSNRELINKIKEKRKQLQLYQNGLPVTKKELNNKIDDITRQLHSYSYFEEAYNNYIQSATSNNVCDRGEYNDNLIDTLNFYKEQLEIINDLDLFKDIAVSEIKVCKSIMHNAYYSCDAVADLEDLMSECMIKDINKEHSDDYLTNRLKLYKHYVVNWTFRLPCMKKAKKKLNCISNYLDVPKTFEGAMLKIKK